MKNSSSSSTTQSYKTNVEKTPIDFSRDFAMLDLQYSAHCNAFHKLLIGKNGAQVQQT